jgi:hypothetical protein
LIRQRQAGLEESRPVRLDRRSLRPTLTAGPSGWRKVDHAFGDARNAQCR